MKILNKYASDYLEKQKVGAFLHAKDSWTANGSLQISPFQIRQL